MNLSEQDWKSFKSLDLGCGCGRHVKFLDEFELEPYGCDLSEVAINLGKEWFRHIGNEKLVQRLFVANVAELPYDSDFFTICVSHGVLDSMPREIAMKGIAEAIRCLKSGGLMYFDLILDENNLSDKEEIQDYGLEKDTVQSYFTVTSIRNFIPKTADIVDFKIINWSDSGDVVFNKRAHVIIRKQ